MSVPRRRVLLLDTSVLVEIIKVPFEADRHDEVVADFQRHVASGVVLRIPAAAVLETGAHVGRIKNGIQRRECASTFVRFLEAALDDAAPWSFLEFTWSREVIRDLLDGTGHGYPLGKSLSEGVFEWAIWPSLRNGAEPTRAFRRRSSTWMYGRWTARSERSLTHSAALALAERASADPLHPRSGTRPASGLSRSHAAPIASTSASRNGLPMTCNPIGSPAAEKPHGTDSAGSPVRLPGALVRT